MGLIGDLILPFFYDKVNHRFGLGTNTPQGIQHTVKSTEDSLDGICKNIGNITASSGTCTRDITYPVIHRADNVILSAGAILNIIPYFGFDGTYSGMLLINASPQTTDVCAALVMILANNGSQYVNIIPNTGTSVSTIDEPDLLTITVIDKSEIYTSVIQIKNNFSYDLPIMYTLDFTLIPAPEEEV
jgi:hypothetical protein